MFKRKQLLLLLAVWSLSLLLIIICYSLSSKERDLKSDLDWVKPKTGIVKYRNVSKKRMKLLTEFASNHDKFSTSSLKQPARYSEYRQVSKSALTEPGCPNLVNTRSERRWFPMLTDGQWENLCNKELRKDPPTDLRSIQFDPSFKNPCWYTENSMTFKKTLHCLPYFLLLGVRKSGTTDLHRRIAAHPEYANPGWKERRFFCGRIFNMSNANSVILRYSTHFDNAILQIINQKTKLDGRDYHPAITGDSTTENSENSCFWPLWPENKGLKEPRIMNYDIIKRLLPDVKIIIKLRDPIDRFYSDYHNLMPYVNKSLISKEHFHATVVNQTKELKKCLESAPFRTCVYHIIPVRLVRFNVNMYVAFVKDLFRVFPRKQVLVINHDEYSKNMESHLNKVFEFLEMRPLNASDLKRVAQMPKANAHSHRRTPMLNKTRRLIYRFMKPYNAKLARILQDESFLYRHPDLENKILTK